MALRQSKCYLVRNEGDWLGTMLGGPGQNQEDLYGDLDASKHIECTACVTWRTSSQLPTPHDHFCCSCAAFGHQVCCSCRAALLVPLACTHCALRRSATCQHPFPCLRQVGPGAANPGDPELFQQASVQSRVLKRAIHYKTKHKD